MTQNNKLLKKKKSPKFYLHRKNGEWNAEILKDGS